MRVRGQPPPPYRRVKPIAPAIPAHERHGDIPRRPATDGTPAAWRPRTITNREYALFQKLIWARAGIHLGASKRELLVGRLARRLRDLGSPSFGAYYEHVTGPAGAEEMVRMLDCITTNETRFFREPWHFEFLEKRVLPSWMACAAAGTRQQHVRVWSAACSTGEEPYSLAMLLVAHLPAAAGWTIEIVASDLSTRVLERARNATWPIDRARSIPRRYLTQFMLRGVGVRDGVMKARQSIRSVVQFHRVNLNDERYPVEGKFDLIFCRNVLMYFDADTRARVADRLSAHLRPGGYVFLGHAESLTGLGTRLSPVGPTIYADVPAPARAPRAGSERRSVGDMLEASA